MRLLFIASVCIQHIYVYFCMNQQITIQHYSSPLAGLQGYILCPRISHSCCMFVRAGRSAFAWPYVGVHWSTSLMSSSLLLQQCPVCLVHLTCIVFVMGGKWPYSWCLAGCYHCSQHSCVIAV